MKRVHKIVGIVLSFAIITLIAGCGGGSSDVATGELKLSLTDAPGDFQAVYVTIKEVRVHKGDDESEEESVETGEAEAGEVDDNAVADDQTTEEDGWIVVATPNKTFNLLELQDGVEAVLGEETLAVGKYTQMRLVLDTEPDDTNNILEEAHPFANYVIIDNNYFEALIPSSFQSGIKLIKGFNITEGATTNIVLDFDAKESFHLTGDSQWKMNPTIKIIVKEEEPETETEVE